MAKITREDLNRLTARQRLRYIQRQRETRIFSGIILVMSFLLVFGVLIGYGVIKVPFLNGFNEEIIYASDGDTPCPSADAKYVPLKDITVTVLNSTDRRGLAGSGAEALKAQGVKIAEVGNYNSPQVVPNVEIETNSTNVAQAYTLAQMFSKADVVLRQVDQSKSGITVILGENFESVKPEEQVRQELTQPLKKPEKCYPLDPNLKAPTPAENEKKSGEGSGDKSGEEKKS